MNHPLLALTVWKRAAENIQEMINNVIVRLPDILLAIIVFLVFYFTASKLKFLVKRLTSRYRHARNLGIVLGRLTQGTTILVGLFVALSIIIPTFKAGDLIQLLGISGVAIGFAFRDILQNFLAGILILLTEPFQIDDQIVFKNFEGTVEDIQTRATTIRTYDGRRIVIPNSELFTNAVTVNTAFEKRRLEYDVGVGYGDNLELAKRLILDAIRSVEGVLSDPPPDALVMELSESTINIRARWWIQPPRRADALDTQDRVLTAIKNQLTANGIDLPFPTYQLLFHDQTEETDGDRARQREGWPKGKGEIPKTRSISGSLKQLAQANPENTSTNHHSETDNYSAN
ncbi:MAG: mechanosensitive ion channel family protein [Snowella sp.]|nr:mechanosensitive ion channel family protein [Snowella sp.]